MPLRKTAQTSAEKRVRTLDVHTNEQKNLLELIASWNEKEDRKYDDVEAALIHLFFTGRYVFNPKEYGDTVKLTPQQLLNLKENIEMYLDTAEGMGFELELKEALKEVDDEILNCSPSSTQRKIRWKGYRRLFGIGLVFFLISLAFASYEKAMGMGCVGAWVIVAGESTIKHIHDAIEKKHTLRHSKLLRKLNSNEISAQLEWAEGHLNKIGWLEKRRPRTKKEKDKLKKLNPDLAKAMKKLEATISERPS